MRPAQAETLQYDCSTPPTQDGIITFQTPPHDDLHDVALVDFPVARFVQMQAQHDAMQRDLDAVARSGDDGAEAARRWVALAQQVQQRYGDASQPFRDAVADADARGDVVTTVELRIPYTTLRWCEDFLMLIEEGDELCADAQLSTPPSPPEVVEFRRWWVGELIRQIRDGATPTPFWADSL